LGEKSSAANGCLVEELDIDRAPQMRSVAGMEGDETLRRLDAAGYLTRAIEPTTAGQ